MKIINPRSQMPIQARPLMGPETVIQGDRFRIAFLTDSMVRLEWSDCGVFEDHCTQMALDRAFEDPTALHLDRRCEGDRLVVETPYIILAYDGGPFSREGLQIKVKGMDGYCSTWHYGDDQHANLGGTARTLDGADGSTKLDIGVNSTDGWALIDDSSSNLIMVPDDPDLPETLKGADRVLILPRKHQESDLYFFGYGHRYREAVRDFYRLTGPTPLLPRFALGNWWSRYHRYTADEYLALMDRFEQEGLPFTTAVVDMDWHLTQVDSKYGTGWTGYTWNRDLFPNPAAFLGGLHSRGMKVTLNVHPRDGIRPFEDPYRQVCADMDRDPTGNKAVEFDLTDPKFVEAYFHMHHDLEEQGVDFWWIDWQQGSVSKLAGLDPLWLLNFLHYADSGRSGRWPMTFSRYAGPGSHRYPIGFSGDTVVSWDSLRFQPYFTATASNIGYGWWSHDIGGHMLGYRDEELEARWYQLGTFSPINRLHSSSSLFNGKEPWNFHQPTRGVMEDFLRLRQALQPYLYTMNWRNAALGKELIEPMYWGDPETAEAYQVPNEYRFGTSMIVAPVTDPMDRDLMRASAEVWLPEGQWFDFFTGRLYLVNGADGVRFRAWRPLESMPVFAPAGALIPLLADNRSNRTQNPDSLRLLVFPGADGSFTMREDDGHYPQGGDLSAMKTADTTISLDWDKPCLRICAVRGESGLVPASRRWQVVLRGVLPARVQVDGVDCRADYDPDTLSLVVTLPERPVGQDQVLTFPEGLDLADNPVRKDVFDICQSAQIANSLKDRVYDLVCSSGVGALRSLETLEYTRSNGDRQVLSGEFLSALQEVLLRAVC